jgi:hypothetical protein
MSEKLSELVAKGKELDTHNQGHIQSSSQMCINIVVSAHKTYLNTCPQSYSIGCFMDEIRSVQPEDMDSEYLSIIGSVYQLRENNIDIVLSLKNL